MPGVLPIGSPPAALVAAFVASINSKCPQPPPLPNTLSAVTFASAPDLMLISAYGCYSELIVSVGPALTPCESQCVVPNPFDFLPTAGPCSFNPPLREIPLSKQDCNTNGVDDLVDILQRTSKDLNQNRIPDECEACKRPRWMNQPVRQQVHVGEQAVFDARAQGSGKLDYQWLFNGRPVPGATQSRLVIDPVASRDAGEYQAVVTYDCGQLRSVPVQLAVIRSRLEIRFRAGKIEVRWQASNVLLQSATRLGGDWTTLTDAESPTIISPPFTQQFFRLVEK